MDPRKLLETLTRNPAASGALGGLAGSLIGNVLMGQGKLKGGGLLKAGGMAAVGYLAWQAWQRRQAGQQGASPAPATGLDFARLPAKLPEAFDLDSPAHSGQALKVVQAMIAAARADGALDASERNRIFSQVDGSGLSSAEQEQVMRQLTQPVDIDSLVQGVDTPEHAAEIYAAASMAAHPVSRAERAWLDMLAARLHLDPKLATEVDRGVEQAGGATS
jgi:uncharacterized membrane protein YebE (DUF533 family)